MIKRVEELERRLRAGEDALRALRDRLQAVDDRTLQLAGGLPPMFGASSAVAIGRAVGSISARSGTTLGTGAFHFASVSDSGVLTEGADPTEVCKNVTDSVIADNSWLLLVKEPKFWVVAAADSCDSLS